MQFNQFHPYTNGQFNYQNGIPFNMNSNISKNKPVFISIKLKESDNLNEEITSNYDVTQLNTIYHLVYKKAPDTKAELVKVFKSANDKQMVPQHSNKNMIPCKFPIPIKNHQIGEYDFLFQTQFKPNDSHLMQPKIQSLPDFSRQKLQQQQNFQYYPIQPNSQTQNYYFAQQSQPMQFYPNNKLRNYPDQPIRTYSAPGALPHSSSQQILMHNSIPMTQNMFYSPSAEFPYENSFEYIL